MKHLAALALALVACTGNKADTSNPELEEAIAGAEGIYRVQSYTRNFDGCSPGGESQLGEERFAVIYSEQVFDRHLLSILSCASPADCRAKLAASEAGEGFSLEFLFTVDDLGAAGQLIGKGASTGFGDGAVCSGAELSTTVVTLAGSELRLEQAITIAPDFPVDGNGACTTVGAQQAASDATCSEMEVLTATFFEPL